MAPTINTEKVSYKMIKRKNYLKYLPSQAIIGVNTYEIKTAPDLKCEGESVYGFCDRSSKTIFLNSNSNCNLAEVLLHEIMHAIWYEGSMKEFKKLSEEQCVNILGIFLTKVFQDNPEVRTYFNKHWSSK